MSISPSEKIKVSIDGNIATLVIDNPSANTWDRESLPALKQVVEALNAEPTVYALVLTGAGEKFFSAGADLNQFASGDADVARAVGDAFGEAFETLADFRGVSIAAINGFQARGYNLTQSVQSQASNHGFFKAPKHNVAEGLAELKQICFNLEQNNGLHPTLVLKALEKLARVGGGKENAR